MIKEYIHLSRQLAELFNTKSKEKNLHYGTFYENQEIEVKFFFEYLYIFDLLLEKNFYYRSS
jgi:hypothetical protein